MEELKIYSLLVERLYRSPTRSDFFTDFSTGRDKEEAIRNYEPTRKKKEKQLRLSENSNVQFYVMSNGVEEIQIQGFKIKVEPLEQKAET